MSFIEMSVKVPTESSPPHRRVGGPSQSSLPLFAESPPEPREAREADHIIPSLIRLQVWHFSKTGRNFGFTRALADALSKVELQGWVIQATNSATLRRNRRDEFVPAEIDFKYQPLFRQITSTNPEELLRVFFHETLPPIIQDFFIEIGKEAHFLTIFPFGNDVDRNIIAKYTHCKLLHSLSVDPDVVNGIIHQISHVDKYTRKLAYKRVGEIPLKSVQGNSLPDEWLAVGTWLARKAITTGIVKIVSKSQRQASYDRSTAAFNCYKELETALELYSKSPPEPGGESHDSPSKHPLTEKAIGNQDLYLTITQMAVAFQIVPFYRKEREMYMSRFFGSTARTICLLSPLVASTVCAFFWAKYQEYQDYGWEWAMDKHGYADRQYHYMVSWRSSLAALCFTLLVVLVNIAEYSALRMYNKNTDKKINDLRVAQGDLVAKFCVRVLKMPPEMMTLGERRAALHNLGVNFHDETPETQRRTLEAFLAKIG